MNLYRRIANTNHEDAGRACTRSVSRHGAGKAKDLARRINRAAKRTEARRALRDQGV